MTSTGQKNLRWPLFKNQKKVRKQAMWMTRETMFQKLSNMCKGPKAGAWLYAKIRQSSRSWNQRKCGQSDYTGPCQQFDGLWILLLMTWEIIRRFWQRTDIFWLKHLRIVQHFAAVLKKDLLEGWGRGAVARKIGSRY